MKKRRIVVQKTISLLSGGLLILQSLFPSISILYSTQAFAQEATPQPTETVTPTPTEEVTPTIEPTPTPPETTPTEAPKNNSPPADDSQGEILDGVSTVAPTQAPPTPTITPVQPETGELSATILENISAPTLDLDGVNPDGSASLSTDKADYAPTDTAIITGINFTPGKSYTLIISSSDEPPVHFETTITANDSGDFMYAYQLDGNYRPNYKVEAKNQEGIAISTITFTDSAFVCQNDIAVNDYSGQRDLTRMCADYSPLPTTLDMTWNWDDASWPGGNTGDGCALFDTNNNGDVNYALCITIGGSPAVFQSKQLYSCDDEKPDRCTNKAPISSSASTTCSASVQSTDPFPTGGAYPNDTTGTCTLLMSDISSTDATLVDVCAYPSNEPNSAPSDCIIATNAQTGNLEIVKYLVPTSDSGKFNLLIDGSVLVSDVGHNGTTGEQQVLASGGSGTAHTFGESAGTETSLSNYATSVECRDTNGTGSIVAITGTNPWTINVVKDKDILCIITNTRVNNGSITIVKDAVPNDAQDFAFTTTGSGLSSFSLDDDADTTLSNTKVFSNLAAGMYAVSESAVTGWNPTSATCDDGSLVSAINLSAGETVTCTFTNTKFGKIIVEKQTNPDGSPQAFTFTPSWGSSFQLSDNGTHDSGNLLPGNYSVTETIPDDWKQQSISCTNGDTDGSFNLQAGETVTCTFNNTQYGSISGKKFIDENGNGAYNPGTESIVTWSFFIDTNDNGVYDSGIDVYTTTTGIPASYSFTGLNPGQTYSICEVSNSNYYQTLPGTGCYSVAAQAGVDLIRDFGNAPKGNIIVKKVMVGGTDTFTFTGDVAGSISANDGTLHTDNVFPSTYTATESSKLGWDITNISCDDGSSATPSTSDIPTGTATFKVDAGETVACTFTNTKRGAISGSKTHDVDADGNLGELEPMLNGWTIFIDENDDGILDPGEVSTTTHDIESNPGEFIFENLVAGTYSVCEVEQVGWQRTVPTGSNCQDAVVTSGQTTYDVRFGNVELGSISGIKVEDVDGDATTTGDQTVLSGWVIQLWKWVTGAFVNTGMSDTTDGNGVFSFENLLPGIYQLRELLKDGWIKIVPSGDGIDVNLSSGEDSTENKFANFELGKITVCKYNDLTGNGQYDAADDQPLADIDITLSQTTNPIDTQSTEEDGCVTFDELSAGTYRVEEDYSDPDLDGYYSTNGITHYDVDVSSGTNETKIFLNALYRTISGTKYNDENGNGTRDPGEPGLEDWTIFIDYNNNGSLDAGEPSITTDVNGNYEFINLAADSYTIAEELKSGWSQTQPTAGHYDVDVHTQITSTGNDFGNQMRGSITIRKDAVPNRAQNFRFTSSQLGNFSLDDDSDPTLSYEKVFTDLGSNNYTITETGVGGWQLTNVSCDGDDNAQIDQDNRTVTINLDRPGESIICTFENTQNGSIAGRKYDDVNGNGALGGSEPYLNEWTIHLFDTDWEQIAQMNTGDTGTAGQYKFTNLVPGIYYICEDLQDGWKQTAPDTDVTRNNSDCHTVTVNPGQDVTGIHFGNFKLGVIQSRKYKDANNNSAKDASEPYLNGWTVRLYEQGDGWQLVDTKMTGHTGTLGQYRFENLNMGTYYLCEVLQPGWTQTDPQAPEGFANQSGNDGEASRCRKVIITQSGQESIGEKHFGNFELGTVQGKKYEDVDGDGAPHESGEAFLNGWTMRLYKNWQNPVEVTTTNTDVLGQYRFSNLLPDTYQVCEVLPPGWTQTWPLAGDSPVADNGTLHTEYGTAIANLSEAPDEGSVCWQTVIDSSGDFNQLLRFGNTNYGTITVDKATNPQEDTQLFDFTIEKDATAVDTFSLQDTDTPHTGSYVAGHYTITEATNADWEQGDISCTGGSNLETHLGGTSFDLAAGASVNCTFNNIKYGTVTVTKFNDSDNDGEKDEEEEYLSGWDMTLTDHMQETTNSDGIATFSYVREGTYIVGEVQQPLWKQTHISCVTAQPSPTPTPPELTLDLIEKVHAVTARPDNEITVHPGETVNCLIGNHYSPPLLRISKDNDTAGLDKSPGASILYTLTLKVLDNNAFGVNLVDLLPQGFIYRVGSWTASITGGTFDHSITEPTYASPGTWDLGNLTEGSEVTLTLIADVSNDQKPGTYKDLALAYGCQLEEPCSMVVATAVAPGDIGQVNHVGTDVNIVKDIQDSKSINVQREEIGTVLGASTELPATGGNVLWIVIASLCILTGVGSLVIGCRLSRRYHA